MKADLIQSIAVTYELSGTSLSEGAKRAAVAILDAYPPQAVRRALAKCVTQETGRLSLSKIIAHIDDGRPGADEAWAMLPRTEQDSAMLTREMGEALELVRHIADDRVAMRRSFLEAYKRLVSDARTNGEEVDWYFSAGMDRNQHEPVLRDAVRRGLIEMDTARGLCPDLIEAAPQDAPQLHGETVPPEEIKKYIQKLKKKFGLHW